MMSIRSFLSLGMALWVLFQAATAARTIDSIANTLINRQDGPGAPDQNSTSRCGAVQTIGNGELLHNVTVYFQVPTLHLRRNNPTPQGTTIFLAIDLEGCNSSFKFGVNSVIYQDETQAGQPQVHEFFYHWAPAQPKTVLPDFPLHPGDYINVKIFPYGDTLLLTITNEAYNRSQIISLPEAGDLCFSDFAVMIQDPSIDPSEIPSVNSTVALNPPVALADFGAVSWMYIGGETADGKDYGIHDAKMTYMKNDKTGLYRVVAFQRGNDEHALIMPGQNDEPTDE
ncbi:hypothetical protein V8F33_007838 [Rhypophila sp. PSN 637]